MQGPRALSYNIPDKWPARSARTRNREMDERQESLLPNGHWQERVAEPVACKGAWERRAARAVSLSAGHLLPQGTRARAGSLHGSVSGSRAVILATKFSLQVKYNM